MRQAIKLEEAVQRLLARCDTVEQETVHVKDSLHYTLASDLYAPFASPTFRRSAYDGFAIREEDDCDFPKLFKVGGVVPCGEVFYRNLLPNETVRIMTGAKLPDNAQKVVMLEQAMVQERGDTVLLLESPSSNNIIPAGSEFKKGDKILSKGHIVNAGTISLLYSFGIEQFSVFRKPRVAVLSTGSELLTLEETFQDGKIYDSNRPLIEQLLKQCHCNLISTENLADDRAKIEERLHTLLQQVDVIVTTGGVSVGDFDYMAHIVQDNAYLFNKIQMRPGSPTSAAMLGRTLLIALSGNPGACFIGFHLFVKPYLQRLTGSQTRVRKVVGFLQVDYDWVNPFDRLLRADYEINEEGQLLVTPIGSDHSNALGNLHQTTCLVKIPGAESGKKRGDWVEVFLL